jgi:ubiquinone/menaquinone biosynthesis C-methylase UbiE
MDSTILTGCKCRVCGNADPADFKLAFKKGELQIIECNRCNFIFIPPYFRKQVNYHDYKDEAVLKAVRQGNDWIKMQRHKLRFKRIKKYQPDGKLFDLGVGWGHFLYAGKLLGYETHGIEISEMPYRYAKEDLKLEVEHIDFFKLQEKPAVYDLITMWDVLEHIDNCDEMIQKCARIIKDKGYIVIQVPQIDSYFAKKYKEKWKMMGLDHVNYFSKKTITDLLARSGFKVKEIKSSLEIKLFIMYVLFPKIQRFKNNKRKTEVNTVTRQEYYNKAVNKPQWMRVIMIFFHNLLYNLLSAMGIGEEMVVIAQKETLLP